MLAVLYSKMGLNDKSERCLSKLLSLSDNVCGGDPSLPDEVLYGRAGYLFSLLFAQQHLGDDKINAGIINQVCNLLLGFSLRDHSLCSGEIIKKNYKPHQLRILS